MNTLHIIFAHQADAFFSLARLLQERNAALGAHGLCYQGLFSPYWQNHSLEPVSGHLCQRFEAGEKQDAQNISLVQSIDALLCKTLAALAAESRPDQDHIWLFGWTYCQSYPFLKTLLDGLGAAAPAKIAPILLAQRQDDLLEQWHRRAWKNYSRSWLAAHLRKEDAFYLYDQALAALEQYLGPARVLRYESDAPHAGARLWADLGDLLGVTLPGDFSPAPYPQSYAGLDVAAALAGFPFTHLGHPAHDRDAFYAGLCHTEQEEGFALADSLPLAERLELLAGFRAGNAALAARLGKTRLFSEPGAQPAELPEQLPCLGSGQARAFISALPEALRLALLRHFRDLDTPLSPEQTVLAQALETYRARFMPVCGHSFPRSEPLLTVLTMTRNHKNYIMDCMESVRAQRTDFPIEHIIVDDASDDGTQDIVDNYAAAHPHVRPLYMPWRSSGGTNIRSLFTACKSRYAALCDGDDYFTEPTKLQKQVDFLTRNQDCALCFHPVLALYEGNTHPSFIYPAPQMMPRGLRDKYYLADLLKGNLIQTNSVVYRWRFRDGLPDWFRSDLCPSDWYWHLLHAETGKLGFIPEIMAVYRRHAASYYAKSFIDHVEHRRQHGMAELETYTAMNAHFNNRYFRAFAAMANGVFTDFFDIQTRQGDSRLLDEASARYPDFALNFLKTLKIIRQSRTRNGDA